MTTLTRIRNPRKISAGFLGNSLGRPREVYAINKNYKGYRIEMFSSLINTKWEAWTTVRGGANTLSLLTFGHDTKGEAQKAIWEEAKRRIAEFSKDIGVTLCVFEAIF